MEKAKITYKGQLTIPKKVRKALDIRESDSVYFLVEGDHAVLRPLKKRSLLDFYGSLPATKPYPGLEAVRKEIHLTITKHLKEGDKQ